MSNHIRHSHLHIVSPPKNPFEGDRLGRSQYSDFLTNIVQNYSSGFVFALNGAWGTGKTVFLHQWKHTLENKGYRVTIFNAWDNDYFEEPTLAILSQFSYFFNPNRPLPEKAITWWKSLQHVPAVAIKGFIKRQVSDVIGEDAVNQIADTFSTDEEKDLSYRKSDVANYLSKRIDFTQFKNALINFAAEVVAVDNKPLVFIIDELDRCTPSYAVEVLEKIKHLFNIPNIIFCIAVDKEQLKRSIQGYYGSFQFNGEEYLRRFFDIELSLPPIPYSEFALLLSEHFELNKHIKSAEELTNFLHVSMSMAKRQNLTLRQIEKFFAHAKLVFSSYSSMSKSEWLIGIMLIMYKFSTELFYNLVDKKYDLETYARSIKAMMDFSEFGSGPINLGCLLYYIDVYLHDGHLVNVANDFKFDYSDFSDKQLDTMSHCYINASKERQGLSLDKIISKICFLDRFVSKSCF